jgi:adsorption protein B
LDVVILQSLPSWDRLIAGAAAAALIPLAVYILLNGLDDILIDGLWLRRCLRSRGNASHRRRAGGAARVERRIAIFVPLWHESGVIASMVEHNLAAIGYRKFAFFLGVYPNDEATFAQAEALEQRFAQVHLALVPHDGPTSKGDCLNWIYQRLLEYEERHECLFDAVLIHDAEDVVHPCALSRIDEALDAYDMVQIPVLPLPMPLGKWTHGVYCDEFAENMVKDLAARVELGAFLPGCGVGTAFRREALERLAAAHSNRIFEPGSLTEDYDNGLRLHRLGCRQWQLPLERLDGAWVATREYFPARLGAAVRQRSRWVTGNALQAWEQFGWGRSACENWFFWRDRKGLWGNPLSLLANLLAAYGVWGWAQAALTGAPWLLAEWIDARPAAGWLLAANGILLVERMLARMAAVRIVYGWRFALLTPLRMVWGNGINFLATWRALAAYLRARWLGEPLRWVKTEHAFPNRAALAVQRRKLGEILVGSGYLTDPQLQYAIATQPDGLSIGEHLVAMSMLSRAELNEALSLQQGLPCVHLEPGEIPRRVARALPAHVARLYRALPFRVENGGMCIAAPEAPDEETAGRLQRYTRLELRFHLVTPENFARLEQALLG